MSNPRKKYRYGSISASVWINDKILRGETVEIPSIKFTKAYKPADSEDWKYTDTFDVGDLLIVAKLAQDVYRDLSLHQSED